MNKWQTGVFTQKVIQQLQEEPKVVVSACSDIVENKSATCLTSVVKDGVCSQLKNNQNTKSDVQNNKYKATNNCGDIELELEKMFSCESSSEEKSRRRRIRRAKRKAELREKINRLFGSYLDEIGPAKNYPMKIHTRRQSLPVSIEVDRLKITTKRKSETDADSSASKQKKKEVVLASQHQVEFGVSWPLVKLDMSLATNARFSIADETSTETAITNVVEVRRDQEVEVNSPAVEVIDLTDDVRDDRYDVTVICDGKEAIKEEEASVSSEKANAPAATSMPLLSPVSPAQPTQHEPTLPETTSTTSINQTASTQRPPPQTHQTLSTLASQQSAFKKPPEPQNNVSILLNQLAQPPLVKTGEVAKALPPYLPRPNVHLQSTIASIVQTAHQQSLQKAPQYQMQAAVQTGFQPPPPYQRSNSNPAPPAPQLIRMYRPSHQGEYRLISNAACGEKLFPHVYAFARWKTNVDSFVKNAQSYLSQQACKEDQAAFSVYINHTLGVFGKRLLKDLVSVEVENFIFREVCDVICAKLLEKGCNTNIFRVCTNINFMIKSCEGLCMTPFTKKFFNVVKLCIERMETRSHHVGTAAEPSVFTQSQMKQLELQIKQYWLIERWSKDYARRSKASSHSGKQQHKKQDSSALNGLHHWVQQTAFKNSLRHVGVSDWSGRKDNPPNRHVATDNPQTEARSVPQIQVATVNKDNSQTEARSVPQIQVATVNKDNFVTTETWSVPQENPQVATPATPERRIVPPTQPEPSPASCQRRVSQETSVIVFPPTASKEPSSEKAVQADKDKEDIIDLTWIDEGDEQEVYEEVKEFKIFPCKAENNEESDSGVAAREAVSPADSGVGSPSSQVENDSFKCLCGKQAIYICACNSSMYCGRECQMSDWVDHQRLCQEMKKS